MVLDAPTLFSPDNPLTKGSMARKPSKRPASRYSYDRVATNIERMISVAGVRQRDVAAAIGASETVFSQKLRGIRSHFTTEELGAIADYFAHPERTGRPLLGFPFLDLELTDLIDRALASRAK